jgi:hypothetical protein
MTLPIHVLYYLTTGHSAISCGEQIPGEQIAARKGWSSA